MSVSGMPPQRSLEYIGEPIVFSKDHPHPKNIARLRWLVNEFENHFQNYLTFLAPAGAFKKRILLRN
jgi:hypothetical protein